MSAISQADTRRRFQAIDAAPTGQQRGQLLEDLANSILGSIPGMRFQDRRQRNYFNSDEIDLSHHNLRRRGGLESLDFPDFILVECKHQRRPAGAIDVCWFLTKLLRRSLTFGILVSTTGITGDADDLSEAHEIGAYFLQQGIRLVVLTRTDLEAVKSHRELVDLVHRRVAGLVLGFRLTD